MLCVLDLYRKYILYVFFKKLGRKFCNVLEMVGGKFKDIMFCYLLKSDIWKFLCGICGIFFRFLFCCKVVLLLLNRIISCDEMNDFLNVMKNEIVECFVFLYNVRKVFIFIVKEDGLLEREFIVIFEILKRLCEENLYIFICNVCEIMKNDFRYVCRVDRKEMKYFLNFYINNEFM